DRRDHAPRRRCRCRAAADSRALRHVLGYRPGQAEGPHVPHRPPWRLQRPDADGHARGRRDGLEAVRGRTGRQWRGTGNGRVRTSAAAMMPKTLRVVLAGEVFTATLNPDAPLTVAAFVKLLPYRQKMIHVRWSGEACWIPLGEFQLGVGFENHTSHPA